MFLLFAIGYCNDSIGCNTCTITCSYIINLIQEGKKDDDIKKNGDIFCKAFKDDDIRICNKIVRSMIANLNNLKNLDSYSICSNLSFCKQTTNFNEKAESINKTVAVLDSLWKNRNVIARKSEKYIKQWIKSTIQQLQQITDLGELWLQVARKKVEAILEEIDAEEEH